MCLPSHLHNAPHALLHMLYCLLYFCNVPYWSIPNQLINQYLRSIRHCWKASQQKIRSIDCSGVPIPLSSVYFTPACCFLAPFGALCLTPPSKCPSICFKTTVLHPSEMAFLVIVNVRKIRSIACSGVPNSLVIVIQYIHQ